MSVCDNHGYWMIDGEMNSVTDHDVCPAYQGDGSCAYCCDNSTYIEHCPKEFAPILQALPTASEEQIEAATAILTGADCRSCVHADNARRRPWCEIAGRYNPDLCECYKKNPERADPGKGGDECE